MKLQLNRRGKGLLLLGIIFGGVLIFPRPATALFGFGDIVFDPSSYATLGHIWEQDISNYSKLVETVTQLERIYANGLQTYNLAHAMSQSFGGANKAQWSTIAQMAVADYTRDQYGESRMWSSAVSGNPNQVGAAWQMATLALDNGTYLAVKHQARVQVWLVLRASRRSTVQRPSAWRRFRSIEGIRSRTNWGRF